MNNRKFTALIGLVCLMSVVFYGVTTHSQTPSPSVRLNLNPAVEQILPFEAEADTYKPPVQLNLQAIDAAGQRITNAKFHVQLQTPPKTPWLTTDFPIVEGTTLLEMDVFPAKSPEGVNASNGAVQFQQTFPIRGTYQLTVEVSPQAANAFPAFQQTLPLTLKENPIKSRNFAILAMILLMVGFGGGWLIGGQQIAQLGEIVPSRVRLLLSGVTLVAIAALIFVNVSAEIAQSGMTMPMSHTTETAPPSQPSKQQSQGLQMQLTGDTSATVGQLSQFQVTVVEAKTQQPATDVLLNIKAIQLESNWVAFAYTGFPNPTGKLAWKEQFFDGAPHKIEVEVSPSANSGRKFQPFRVEQTIEVEGVAPPFHVRLIGLVYFTSFVVLGLLIGFGLRRKQRSPSQRTVA